jgi:hypothetical protein
MEPSQPITSSQSGGVCTNGINEALLQKVSKKANWFRKFEHEQTFDAENFVVVLTRSLRTLGLCIYSIF